MYIKINTNFNKILRGVFCIGINDGYDIHLETFTVGKMGAASPTAKMFKILEIFLIFNFYTIIRNIHFQLHKEYCLMLPVHTYMYIIFTPTCASNCNFLVKNCIFMWKLYTSTSTTYVRNLSIYIFVVIKYFFH